MYKSKCLIDGKYIISKTKNWSTRKLIKYIKEEYNLNFPEYLIKYKYNNKNPLCFCGCGKKTKFHKSDFLKYYSNHKNKVKPNKKTIDKIKKANQKYHELEVRLKRLGISKKLLKELYVDYCNFKTNFSKIHSKYGIDKRTIKKYWLELEFIQDKVEFENIKRRHQFYWNNGDKIKKKIDLEKLLIIYLFLEKNQGAFTLKEIITKFGLEVTPLVLYTRLKENFEEEKLKQYLKSGLQSKPELEHFNMLKYFFGDNIKKQFRLENKFYDYILGDEILIEFDGDYWHNKKENILNDKKKNDIAIKNGYKLFRIKESNSKDIEILLKLKNLYDETKIQRDRKKNNQD